MKMKIKKILSVGFISAIALSMTACNEDSELNNTDTTFSCIDGSLISGECKEDIYLSKANSPYFLTGNKIKIKNNSTLTIEPGVQIYAEEQSYLIVTRGSKIYALGNSLEPIYFSSINEYRGEAAGIAQWGGVVVLGNAKTNNEPNHRFVIDQEDPDFVFGGPDDDDNSGIIQNVFINNAGYAVSDANDFDINALSLSGVGRGTVVKNITVLNSGDDGIEMFGGTVNLSNLYIENITDDAIDVEEGYRGTIDGVTIIDNIKGRSGIEMSNDLTVDSEYPVSTNVTLKNFNMYFSNLHERGGALYWKDDSVTAHFENGYIDFDSPISNDSSLFNKNGVGAGSTMKNITIKDSSSRNTVDGDVDGAIILNQVFSSDSTNKRQ